MSESLVLTLAPAILGLLIAYVGLILLEIYWRRQIAQLQQHIARYRNLINEAIEGEMSKEGILTSRQNAVTLQRRLTQIDRWHRVVQLIVLILSVAAAFLAMYLYLKEGAHAIKGALIEFIAAAYAQPAGVASGGVQAPPYLGGMLTAILVVMLAVFLFAVLAVLFLKDIPENTSRRASANDIVKTFGGFFIGILTSFLKQAIGP